MLRNSNHTQHDNERISKKCIKEMQAENHGFKYGKLIFPYLPLTLFIKKYTTEEGINIFNCKQVLDKIINEIKYLIPKCPKDSLYALTILGEPMLST